MKSTILIIILAILSSCNQDGKTGETKSCALNLPIKTFNSLGVFTTTALTEEGEIWQWSISNTGPANIQVVNIKNVCSIDYCRPYGGTPVGFALQKNGKIKQWDTKQIEYIEEIKTEKPVKKIACGLFHVLFLYSDGTVGGRGDEVTFMGFNSLRDVVDIAAGNNYSIACTKEGKVFVTGETTGNYVAYQGGAGVIDYAFQIQGLENIVKVGTTGGQNHYAIDESGFMYYWDTKTYIDKVNFRKTPEKAIGLIEGEYYLSADLKIKRRPDLKRVNNAGMYLDFETDEKLANAIDVYRFRAYGLALYNDGSVVIFDIEEYTGGRSRIVSEEKVPDLKVDLNYYR